MKLHKYLKSIRQFLEEGIRDVVFGTQDGLVSTLGVLTGIAQGTQDQTVVVISGLVVVSVEALSMAAGSYLSSKAHRQHQEKLLSEEMEQIENNISNEIDEIFSMYRTRGYQENEINIIKKRLLSDKTLLLEDMAHKELGIVPQKFEKPLLNALLMGISYIIGGLIPTLSFLLIYQINQAMILAFLSTGTALFLLGAVKGIWFKVNWFKSGLEILIVAGMATALGYSIGSMARFFFL